MGTSEALNGLTGEEIIQYKLHPVFPLIFLGTKKGELLVGNLQYREIIHREGFFEMDEFGELSKIETPIRNIAFSQDFEQVYAFTKIGAICLNVATMEKIAEIPLEEPLVFGDVDSNTGDIAILTEDGYISRWTPKFHSRSGYFELGKRGLLKKIRMVDENTIIGLGTNNDLYMFDFSTHKISKLKEYGKASFLLVENPIQSNEEYFAYLTSIGKLLVGKISNPSLAYFQEIINTDTPQGDVSFVPTIDQQSTYEFLKDHFNELGDYEEEFHEDLRFQRSSKDKYDATAEHVNDFKKIRKNINESWDPDLVLHFAIKDFVEGEQRAGPLRLIALICKDYGLDPQLAIFSWKLNGRRKTNLINFTREIMKVEKKRRQKIRYLITIGFIFASITVIDLIYPFNTNWSTGIAVLGIVGSFFIFRAGNRINRLPKIPSIETYWLLRFFILSSTIIAALIIVLNPFWSTFMDFFP